MSFDGVDDPGVRCWYVFNTMMIGKGARYLWNIGKSKIGMSSITCIDTDDLKTAYGTPFDYVEVLLASGSPPAVFHCKRDGVVAFVIKKVMDLYDMCGDDEDMFHTRVHRLAIVLASSDPDVFKLITLASLSDCKEINEIR